MKCPECGHETIVDVKFCPSCGEQMPTPEDEAQEAPAAQPEPEEQAQPAGPEPSQPPEPEEPSVAPAPSASTIVTTPASVAQFPQPESQATEQPEPVTPPPTTPPAAPPATPPATQPPAEQPPAQPPATPPAEPKKRGSSWWMWACGGCGCFALILALLIGSCVYFAAHEETGTDGDDNGLEIVVPGEEGEDEGENGGEAEIPDDDVEGGSIAMDHFAVEVPEGWARNREAEAENSLALDGPTVEGASLSLVIQVDELSEGTTLQQYSDAELADIMRPFSEDTTEASLCGEPARRVAYSAEGNDVLKYLCVYKNAGFHISMVAPQDTMAEQEKTFDQVLNTFAMYE